MMNVIELAERISELPLAEGIRAGTLWEWAFPTIETLHVIAITTVFGSIAMLDLRMLGWYGTDRRLSAFAAALIPLTWAGFCLALVSGALMFIARAPDYLLNLQFQLKMAALLIAGLNMLVFQFGVFRRIDQWDEQLPPPRAARMAGLVSLSCWTATVFLGRWIGFTIDSF